MAPVFDVADLVAWLATLPSIPHDDDALYAALLTAPPDVWPALRKLRVVPVEVLSVAANAALEEGLFVLGGEVSAPLLCIWRVVAGGATRRGPPSPSPGVSRLASHTNPWQLKPDEWPRLDRLTIQIEQSTITGYWLMDGGIAARV